MSGTANTATADTPQVLLEHHLKMLRLPTFLREYDKVARQCSDESVDYPQMALGDRLVLSHCPHQEFCEFSCSVISCPEHYNHPGGNCHERITKSHRRTQQGAS